MIGWLVKSVAKGFLQMIIWVFILSIKWQDVTLFDYCRETFIQTEMLTLAENQMLTLWSNMKVSALGSLRKVSNHYSKTIEQKSIKNF